MKKTTMMQNLRLRKANFLRASLRVSQTNDDDEQDRSAETSRSGILSNEIGHVVLPASCKL